MSEPSWNRQIRDARRARGWTQSLLARKAACTQSAVSMMENGREDALSRETLQRIVELLELESSILPTEDRGGGAGGKPGVTALQRFCPVFDCPSNHPYLVQGELRFIHHSGSHTRGPHCPLCGELLESTCPNPECGTPVNGGACCEACGIPYVCAPWSDLSIIEAWLAKVRESRSGLPSVY